MAFVEIKRSEGRDGMPDETARLLEIRLTSTARGTLVWCLSDILEPFLSAQVVQKGLQTKKTNEGKLYYPVPLTSILEYGGEEERFFIDYEEGYLEQGGCFNLAPLTLAGIGKGAEMLFGPSNNTMRDAYMQAMERAVSCLFNNVIHPPSKNMEIRVKKWDANGSN